MISLQGIVPPLITPLTTPNTLDMRSLFNLIEHTIKGGASGLFILGTTGESPSLTRETRQTLIVQTCQKVNKRVPVLVGITDTSFSESIALATLAADSGADAVVLSAPYYFPINQSDLFLYVQNLSKACPLPIFLYNMPSCTKVAFEIETLIKLTQIDAVIGIKDSSGDMIYFKELIDIKQMRPDWSVLIGPEQLIAEAIHCGGDGGVCGGANLFPELYVRLYNASLERNSFIAEKLQQVVMEVAKYIYKPDYLRGLKYAMSLQQICLNILAEPLHAADPEQQLRIREFMSRFDLQKAISAVYQETTKAIVVLQEKKNRRFILAQKTSH